MVYSKHARYNSRGVYIRAQLMCSSLLWALRNKGKPHDCMKMQILFLSPSRRRKAKVHGKWQGELIITFFIFLLFMYRPLEVHIIIYIYPHLT